MPTGMNRYALQGRVVTMDDNLPLLGSGIVYIQGDKIADVRSSNEQPPDGFENTKPIQTNGTIYPGLIELHNHLSYDILPLWDVPKKYKRRSQWANNTDKTRLITGPMQVLGHSQGYPEAIVRYVEAKCLLAGVTTSQGIPLSGVGIEKFYKGIVRNVDQTSKPELPRAKSRISDVEAKDLQSFSNSLKNSTCLLLHLSEGVDERSRDAFRALQFPNGNWSIIEALAGIHCTALLPEHFQILENHGASMVWSPLSNLLLYGETAKIEAAKAAGITIALGSDWSPSGSKNLLGELKSAHLVSQQQGGLFTPRELVAMVTVNPARILKWQNALGSVKKDLLADIIVLDGKQGDPYENLIAAKESSIILVVIDGVPRYWSQPLSVSFGAGTEQVSVGGEIRTLNLHDEASNLNMQGLTLEAAQEKLQDGLHRLPELALLLENSLAMGGAIGFDPLTNQSFPTLVLDEDELQRESLRPLLGSDEVSDLQEMVQLLESIQYSELLEDVVVELDPLTIEDDPHFFPLLAGQVNLTYEFKQGLASFYNVQLQPPDGGRFILHMQPSVRSQFWTARDLPYFRNKSGYLSLEDRQLIIEQALVMLERVYVHLPFKRAMHAVDPVQHLKLLQYRLEKLQSDYKNAPDSRPPLPLETAFHREMTAIFTSLRDLHTNYLWPEPYRDKIAFLPFLIEEYFEGQGEQRKQVFLASKILPGARTKTFTEGVEVLYWNGVPIQQAVELNGERQAGSNLDARFARGLESLTVRPLVRSLPPDEDWVSLRYLDKNGKEHDLQQKWLVFSLGDQAEGVDADGASLLATALGYDLQTDFINQTKKLLFAPEAVAAELEYRKRRVIPPLKHPILGDLIPSTMPTIFRVKSIHNEFGDFGYVRIFTFNVEDDTAFIEEFVSLVQLLPQSGLIIDVRNNGGGLIYAAERLLQVLTPHPIEPQRAQFINTLLTLEICRQHAPSNVFAGLDLGQWIQSIEQSVETGASYSLGYPITPPEKCRDIGQKYPGPVILITDALCYSATDMFVAGFQDHRIGKILGTSGNTGAGGANVWTHALLDRLLRKPEAPLEPLPSSPFKPLPFGTGIRVAIRRTLRVGPQNDVPVEDLGVLPDERYYLTREDLINGNVGLIYRACQMLAGEHAKIGKT